MVLELTTQSKAAVNERNPVKNKFTAGTVSDQDSDKEDELPCSWMKKVELPTFEGNDPILTEQ